MLGGPSNYICIAYVCFHATLLPLMVGWVLLAMKNAVVTNMHGSPVLFDDVTINRLGSTSRLILRVHVGAANHVTFSFGGALHLLS